MDRPSLHPASHLTLSKLSRADGRSSVAAAAYAARTRMHDARLGRTYNYRSVPGLLAEGLVGWSGTAEALWNAAEAAETRRNACTSRELRPALPAELPLDDQARLLRGYCAWLRDTHGVAVHWVIHAPRFASKADEKALWTARGKPGGMDAYLAAASDPEQTNLNFHAHIRISVRQVDAETGSLGDKLRDFDRKNPFELSPKERREGRKPARKITGREVVQSIRDEWETRVNRALERAGSDARIDMRSYERMAADGDAPEGMQAQPHVGPRAAARARAARRKGAKGSAPLPQAVVERERTRTRNDDLMASWLVLRALERERARLEEEGLAEAQAREQERKTRAAEERRQIEDARTERARQAAVEAATSIDAPWAVVPSPADAASPPPPPPGDDRPAPTVDPEPPQPERPAPSPLEQAIADVERNGVVVGRDGEPTTPTTETEDGSRTGPPSVGIEDDEDIDFDTPLDPETYDHPHEQPPPNPQPLVRVRVRGPRTRGRGD